MVHGSDDAMSSEDRILAPKLLWDEVREVFLYAWPVVASYLFMMSLPIACLFFVGVISEEALAATGLSLMFQNITGTSICVGLASGLETFASQLNGAGEYRLVGVVYQRAIFVLGVATVPMAIVWWFTGELLGLCGIGSDMTAIAGPFMRIMILGLPGMAILECTKRWLHAQGFMSPVFHVSILINLLHVASLWVLVKVDALGLGVHGAAASMVISYTANAALLLLYVWWFGLHKATWFGWTWECTKGCWEYLKIALPGLGMLCLEWWSFEIVTLFSGQFGTAAVAAQTVLFNTVAIFFMVPLGIGIAATTRVGNALGAGNSVAAKRTSIVSILSSVFVTICCSVVFYLKREAWARMFTNQDEVVALVVAVIPIQASFFLSDSAAGVSSGIVRGAGRQHVGFVCNLVAFYLVGIPLGLYLGFERHLALPGLWYGLAAGSFAQSSGTMAYLCSVRWRGLAEAAGERVARQQEQSSKHLGTDHKERDNQELLPNAV